MLVFGTREYLSIDLFVLLTLHIDHEVASWAEYHVNYYDPNGSPGSADFKFSTHPSISHELQHDMLNIQRKLRD